MGRTAKEPDVGGAAAAAKPARPPAGAPGGGQLSSFDARGRQGSCEAPSVSSPGARGGFIADFCLPQQGVWDNDEPGIPRSRPRAGLAGRHREAALPRACPESDDELFQALDAHPASLADGRHGADERWLQRLEKILESHFAGVKQIDRRQEGLELLLRGQLLPLLQSQQGGLEQLLSEQRSKAGAQLDRAVERLEEKLDGIQVQFGAGLRSINDGSIGNLEGILRRGIEEQNASIVEAVKDHLVEAAASHREAVRATPAFGHHWSSHDLGHHHHARPGEHPAEDHLPGAKVHEPMEQAHGAHSPVRRRPSANSWEEEVQNARDEMKRNTFRNSTAEHSPAHGSFIMRGVYKFELLLDHPWFHEPARTGRLAQLNEWLSPFFLLVISLNAAFMIVTVNHEMAQIRDTGGTWHESWMLQVEIAFLGLYTIELLLKLIVHRLYFFVNGDWFWNWLDLGLVLYSSLEMVSILLYSDSGGGFLFLRVLRIFKMTKVARLFRLISSFKELRLILACIVGSASSLFWSIVFITFIYYVFALVLVQGVGIFLASQGGDPPDPGRAGAEQEDLIENFGAVEIGILTLYRASMGGDDWSLFYLQLKRAGVSWHLQALYLFFIAFTQIALVNIITGIFVERAMVQGKPNLVERSREHVKEEAELAAVLEDLVKEFDTSGDGFMTPEKFFNRAPHHPLNVYLRFLGVDDGDMQEFLEKTGSIVEQGVLVSDFVHGCMKVKGAASNLDMQALKFGMTLLQTDMERQERKVVKLSRHLGMRSDEVQVRRKASSTANSDGRRSGSTT